MENWAFFSAENGNELARGWQGTEGQARKLARSKAALIGGAVEFIAESELRRPDGADDDWTPPDGEVVELDA
jgi:hypothetical protein